MSTSSIRTASMPTPHWKRPWARWRTCIARARRFTASRPSPELTRKAAAILKSEGVPLLIHQPNYSMLNRTIESGLLPALEELGVGCIGFAAGARSPDQQYLGGVPEGPA
jgi:hypothetical protein